MIIIGPLETKYCHLTPHRVGASVRLNMQYNELSSITINIKHMRRLGSPADDSNSVLANAIYDRLLVKSDLADVLFLSSTDVIIACFSGLL